RWQRTDTHDQEKTDGRRGRRRAPHCGRTVLRPGRIIPSSTRAAAPSAPPEQNLRQNPGSNSKPIEERFRNFRLFFFFSFSFFWFRFRMRIRCNRDCTMQGATGFTCTACVGCPCREPWARKGGGGMRQAQGRKSIVLRLAVLLLLPLGVGRAEVQAPAVAGKAKVDRLVLGLILPYR